MPGKVRNPEVCGDRTEHEYTEYREDDAAHDDTARGASSRGNCAWSSLILSLMLFVNWESFHSSDEMKEEKSKSKQAITMLIA